MHLLKSFNDRRTAKKNAQNIEQWKQNKGRALADVGAFNGKTNGDWERSAVSSKAESQAANELNW